MSEIKGLGRGDGVELDNCELDRRAKPLMQQHERAGDQLIADQPVRSVAR